MNGLIHTYLPPLRPSLSLPAVSVALLLAGSNAGYADELARKVKAAPETYPQVEVIYDSVVTPKGERLRTIMTRPPKADGKLPVIFVAGWLSCDSIEAPSGTREAAALVFQHLAQLHDFCLFRVEKQGVGDSEGTCAATDFESELAGYRAAFRALDKYSFVDPKRIYILGISNGGGFAPLVAETEAEQKQICGYVVVGGWVKTWFEHMLEIERRSLSLMGNSPGEVNEKMKKVAALYSRWLIDKQDVASILAPESGLADLWPEGNDHEHLYGRPLEFYEQLQHLNLAAAWARIGAPTLVLHGEYDWIMSKSDHEEIAKYVNANKPGAARFIELAETGHTFQHCKSLSDAFRGIEAPFDPKVITVVTDWLHEIKKK